MDNLLEILYVTVIYGLLSLVAGLLVVIVKYILRRNNNYSNNKQKKERI